MLEPLDAVGIEPTEDHGGGVHTRVIPVKKPLLGHHLRPFQLQILYSMRSRKRPGVNPCSSATAAASEAMKSAVRTVSLRRRWRAQWRAPLGVLLQRTQALVPVGTFHGFFLISVKLLPALARSATKSRILFIPELCGGGPTYDWLRSILPEHSGISDENRFNTTCS